MSRSKLLFPNEVEGFRQGTDYKDKRLLRKSPFEVEPVKINARTLKNNDFLKAMICACGNCGFEQVWENTDRRRIGVDLEVPVCGKCGRALWPYGVWRAALAVKSITMTIEDFRRALEEAPDDA